MGEFDFGLAKVSGFSLAEKALETGRVTASQILDVVEVLAPVGHLYHLYDALRDATSRTRSSLSGRVTKVPPTSSMKVNRQSLPIMGGRQRSGSAICRDIHLLSQHQLASDSEEPEVPELETSLIGTLDESSCLVDEYHDQNGQVYAREQVDRSPSKFQMHAILKMKCQRLEEAVRKEPDNHELKKELAEVHKRFEVLDKQIQSIKTYRLWVDSELISEKEIRAWARDFDPAEIEAKIEELEALPQPRTFELIQILSELREVAKNPALLREISTSRGRDWEGSEDLRLFSVEMGLDAVETGRANTLVNGRMHTLRSADGEIQANLFRLGTLADGASFFSLDDLNECLEDPTKLDEQLEVLSKLLEGSKGQQKNAILRAQAQLIQAKEDPAYLEDLIRAKKSRLEESSLQFLMAQLEARAQQAKEGSGPKLDPSQSLAMVDLRLLDLKKDEVHVSGVRQNEHNWVRDHRRALEMLNGKHLVVDPTATAPYIDGNKVCIPPMQGFLEEGAVIPLEVYQFVHSPVRRRENTEAYHALNQPEVQRLERCRRGALAIGAPQKFVGEDRQDFDVDLATSTLQHFVVAARSDPNLFVSNGCAYGNDRTGMMDGIVMQRERHAYAEKKGIQRKKSEDDLFSKERVAARVILQNKGHSIVKIAPHRLLAEGDTISTRGRVSQIAQQVVGLLRGQLGSQAVAPKRVRHLTPEQFQEVREKATGFLSDGKMKSLRAYLEFEMEAMSRSQRKELGSVIYHSAEDSDQFGEVSKIVEEVLSYSLPAEIRAAGSRTLLLAEQLSGTVPGSSFNHEQLLQTLIRLKPENKLAIDQDGRLIQVPRVGSKFGRVGQTSHETLSLVIHDAILFLQSDELSSEDKLRLIDAVNTLLSNSWAQEVAEKYPTVAQEMSVLAGSIQVEQEEISLKHGEIQELLTPLTLEAEELGREFVQKRECVLERLGESPVPDELERGIQSWEEIDALGLFLSEWAVFTDEERLEGVLLGAMKAQPDEDSQLELMSKIVTYPDIPLRVKMNLIRQSNETLHDSMIHILSEAPIQSRKDFSETPGSRSLNTLLHATRESYSPEQVQVVGKALGQAFLHAFAAGSSHGHVESTSSLSQFQKNAQIWIPHYVLTGNVPVGPFSQQEDLSLVERQARLNFLIAVAEERVLEDDHLTAGILYRAITPLLEKLPPSGEAKKQLDNLEYLLEEPPEALIAPDMERFREGLRETSILSDGSFFMLDMAQKVPLISAHQRLCREYEAQRQEPLCYKDLSQLTHLTQIPGLGSRLEQAIQHADDADESLLKQALSP